MQVIDVHAHIFPDKIASRAAHNIGVFYDGFTMHCDGSVRMLLEEGDKAGVGHFLVHSVATTPAQIHNVNAFIAEQVQAQSGRFIGFGSLHPDMEDVEAGLDSLAAQGLCGVKLHPDMQRFALNEERAISLVKAIEARRLPLMIHAGDKRYSYSNPEQIRGMLSEAPNLTVIAAHFGGYSVWDEAEALAGRDNLYVDCSSSMYAMTDEEIVRRIRLFGADHVMFGSDYPMWTPGSELERVMNLPLHEDEREQVLWKTAAAVLGLDK